MKRIFTIIIIGLLIVSCKQENRTDYIINGNAKEVYNGVRVYLKSIDKKGNQIVNDTAIVFDGKFKMNGSIEEPSIYFLSVDGTQGDLIFMLENSEIDIDINKTVLMESKVSGSKTNEGHVDFQESLKEIRKKSNAVMIAYRQVRLPEETAKKDSISKALEKIEQRLLNHPLDFVMKNNDTYFSLNLIGLESNKSKFDIINFTKAFQNLSPELKETKKGKEVRERLDSLYKAYQKTAHIKVGKIAPNFEAPTPNGDIVSLNEIKGKVTIIDFWAAWCGPCRRENPNVVRIYNKFHSAGLEIIGVSLDGQSRQNEPKKAWLDAIEKDNLTWTQVSHLQYFNDPVAQLYNITSIPATFLLDKDGKIAYKNLRGRALELKVQELLEK